VIEILMALYKCAEEGRTFYEDGDDPADYLPPVARLETPV
jgi:hypothetical protein